jgi:hypothetical protein
LRDNGAIAGGAAGFTEDDEVIVLKKYDGSKIYVVGHKDGIRSCGWRFKLLRDDGTVMTDAAEYAVEIYFYDSDHNLIVTENTYDSETQYWTVKPSGGKDPDGYFVKMKCSDSVNYVQYPYRWKPGDWWQTDDLVKPGTYTAPMPYFRYTKTHNVTAEDYRLTDPWDSAIETENILFREHVPGHLTDVSFYCSPEFYHYCETEVFSSVPYTVREWCPAMGTIYYRTLSGTYATEGGGYDDGYYLMCDAVGTALSVSWHSYFTDTKPTETASFDQNATFVVGEAVIGRAHRMGITFTKLFPVSYVGIVSTTFPAARYVEVQANPNYT